LIPDSSAAVVLLGLLSVLFLWCEPLVWWTKAATFTGFDLVFFFGVINGFLGAYLSGNQKIVMAVVCFGLVPVAFLLSWLAKPEKQLSKMRKDIYDAIKKACHRPTVKRRRIVLLSVCTLRGFIQMNSSLLTRW